RTTCFWAMFETRWNPLASVSGSIAWSRPTTGASASVKRRWPCSRVRTAMSDDPSGLTSKPSSRTRAIISHSFTWVEDIVYLGLAVLLAASALALLGQTAIAFFHDIFNTALPKGIVSLLDRLLLVLMIVELLYTVQVSFREHALVPEPFLIVGLVA